MILKYLNKFSDKFSQNRDTIIHLWLEYQEVKNIFNHYNINLARFKLQFANQIFDYYITLFKNKITTDSCPITVSFLAYLSQKKVAHDEVFVLCSSFRKSMTTFIYNNNIASQELLDELHTISDQNIKDIIKYYHVISKDDENALLSENRSLLEAQRIAKIGHWELDLRNDHLFWSDEVYRIFGLEPNSFEATYEAFLERIHPDDVEMLTRTYSNSVKNKTSYNLVHRILTLNNELKYIEERCSHRIDKDGNVFKSVGTVHDITDQVSRHHETQLSSMLFKHSNDAVVITDKDNNIIMINKQFTNLTGYTIEEIEGKNPQYFSAGWGDVEFYKDMWSQILNHGIYKGEVWDKKKSGEAYAAALTILCVKDDNGDITNYIGISNDITANKDYQKRIEQLSYYDNLTKLPNRVYFKEKVKTYMASYDSHQTKCAILVIDVDNFKWINDSLGHKVGNDVLIEIADRIRVIINKQSLLSRMGGDEFAVLCPYQSILEVNNLVRKIYTSAKKPIKVLDKEITFGLSVGISMFPENGSSYSEVLQNADTAMYQAKANGKNNFVYFTHEMNENSLKRLDIDTSLHQAIQNNNFSMVYQPKVSLQTKEVYGMEALIRWNDPVLGFVSPDIFIPIAEESKLIDDIGYWVIEKSLEEFNAMLPHAKTPLLMSINISAKQFNDKNLLQKISYIIQRSKVDPKNIEFEITETAIMDNIESILEILKQIKALGISISIDDFGTGHSSMAYLKKLPIDTIKIDRAFIKDIDFDNGDKAITNAIVTMSKQLGLKTIAEGIETNEHERIVQEMGVDNAQGYLYSKGLSCEEFIKFIQEKNKQ